MSNLLNFSKQIFDRGTFGGEVLLLLGIYDILTVFLTQLQYFFNHTYSVTLAQPYQNNHLAL